MKKLMMVLMACLASSVAFCRSLSIDLRKSASKGVVRAMAQRHVASAAVEDSGFIRKVNLDAGVADVGTVAVGDELALTLFEDVSVTLTLKQQMPSPMGGAVFLAETSGYEGVKNAVVLRTAVSSFRRWRQKA